MAIANFTNGDTRQWDVQAYATGGGVLDLTGYTCYMTFKTSLAQEDADPSTVQLTGAIDADPTTGKVVFLLTSVASKDMTGTYNYDVQLTSGDATPEVTTIESGTVKVSTGVTKSPIV